MARGPRYKVPRRRRREGKTNYYKRYRMVLSKQLRFVVRKTNKYIWVQIIEFKPQGDHVIAAAHSQELVKKYGWLGGTKNTSAAYLTGLLAALRAISKGVKYAIPDIGLHAPVKGAKVFAAIKAANDIGLKIPCSEEVYPSDDRIRGVHISNWAQMLYEKDPILYNRFFSMYLKKGFDPRNIVEHFNEVKNRIIDEYKSVLEKR
ncbi:MAG: 50S ribosomal protein L18 [Desulfurococcaceae archaeon]|uniref:Large ribosomal subunit protein uL18 n=1 Tax=Staphylothermus marinus TaxID=2280 RepID=A0A7C4HF10_STAMA